MEPAAGKGFVGRGLVVEIALHHNIAAEHDFAQRLAVGGHLDHGVGIHDGQAFEGNGAHTLACALGRDVRGGQIVPGGLPFIDDGGAIGFG